jgi:predicted permease
MFRSYIKIAWRSLVKNRQFTFLNLLGLSTGMAGALFIYLWVFDEINIDKFHANDRRLYQVLEHAHNADGIHTNTYQPGILEETLVKEMPEVQYATGAGKPEENTFSAGEKNIRVNGMYAGKDYFNVFSYPLLQGNKNQVLGGANNVVISASVAGRLFGSSETAMGKTITIRQQEQYVVTGVFKDVPANSSEQFDYLLSFDALKKSGSTFYDWRFTTVRTYVVLKEHADVSLFNRKIARLIERKSGETSRTLSIAPYSDNYLYGKYENGVQTGGRIEYIKLVSIIAVFILLIACINFMNLSTAKASGRMKEIGIRKSLGAVRKTLIIQYLGESMLMAFISLFIAFFLIILLLPVFNNITGKHLLIPFQWHMLLCCVAVTLITGFVAGSYPALYLSGFNPIAILKGKVATSTGELWTRKGLVVFQFLLSVVLITSVVVIYQQLTYVQTRNLGYDKNNIIYFAREGQMAANLPGFLSAVKEVPGVVQASSIGQTIVGGSLNSIGDLKWEGKQPDDKISFEIRPVNYDMIEMLGIQMAEGRSFSRAYGADSLTNLIFNETAIKTMGLKNPIGKTIGIQGGKFQISGVVKDFHFASLHEKVAPLFFMLRPEWTQQIMIRMEAGKETATLQRLQTLYQRYNPGFPFTYKFLDQAYQQQYTAELRIAALSRYFTGLAIMIACLGLYGLAAFTAERKRREISIRKVLGATVSNITFLLSGEFLRYALVAVIIAVPLSWWAMNKWLEGFAYHIGIGADVFLIAGGAMLLITVLTVSFQSIKAAMANPVNSLKAE